MTTQSPTEAYPITWPAGRPRTEIQARDRLKTGRIKKIPVDSDGTPHWYTCCDAPMVHKGKNQERGNR